MLLTQNLKDLFDIEYYHSTPLSQFEDFKNIKEFDMGFEKVSELLNGN